jgi:hypothetical protein
MSTAFWVVGLFLVLALLFAIEASTSFARVAGLESNSLASGMQLQSGLSLFSRALMAIFMPALGALADAGHLEADNLPVIFVGTLLIPISVFVTYVFREAIFGLYYRSALNLSARGSYFPLGVKYQARDKVWQRRRRPRGLRLFRLVTLLSYIPYYLSWPLIMVLLSIFSDNRGLILGLSSVMNGLNTLALVLYVDPLLIRLSAYNALSRDVYRDQVIIRIYASMFSSVPFLLVFIYMLLSGWSV